MFTESTETAGTFIGSGRVAKVYLIDNSSQPLARREFAPASSARTWNWFFYESPHPLTTKTGWQYAYWKRRLAHVLSQYVSDNMHIVDATAPVDKGFISPFIRGSQPKRSELQAVRPSVEKLERVFNDIGMPTWSFSRRNPFSASNFIVSESGHHIIDYEQSVPIPDIRGNMSYDEIYFDDVQAFINENKVDMDDRLGTEGITSLEEAFTMAKESHSQLDLRPRTTSRFDKISRALNERGLDRAVEKLYREGKMTEEELDSYRNGQIGELTRLAFMNLGVHCAIGLATPPWILTPVSAALRLTWTTGNWVRYSISGDHEKRDIHNWRVMVVSALPLPFPLSAVSNGAYIQSIMEQNADLGIAICDNLVREFTGMCLEEAFSKLSSKKLIKSVVRAYERLPLIRPILGPNTKRAHDILLSYLST